MASRVLPIFEVDVSEVIVDGGVAAVPVRPPSPARLRLRELALAVVDPAQAIEIGAVVRVLIDGLLDQLNASSRRTLRSASM